MRRALYDSQSGYYMRQIAAVGGERADFATSASLDPGFAAAIARWIEDELARRGDVLVGEAGEWHLIELGGGGGHLTAGVLKELRWPLRRDCRYHVLEVSPVLQELQKRTLKALAKRVTWHDSIEKALGAAGGRALIFSNEFVDAFPATVIQWDEEMNAWYEVYLENRGGRRFAEVLLPVHFEPETFSAMDHSRWAAGPLPLLDGQRCELLASWREWLLGWAPGSRAVSMLTIDYGDTFPMIYRGRHAGTLRAYRKHHRLTGSSIYANAGKQDLTVDVNFTDLQDWGEEAGLTTAWFVSQREFLDRYGQAASGELSLAAEFLRDPAGAGEAFRVLCQRK